jgi:hypothetical protein
MPKGTDNQHACVELDKVISRKSIFMRIIDKEVL